VAHTIARPHRRRLSRRRLPDRKRGRIARTQLARRPGRIPPRDRSGWQMRCLGVASDLWREPSAPPGPSKTWFEPGFASGPVSAPTSTSIAWPPSFWLTEPVLDGKMARRGSMARGICLGAATASSQPGHESWTAGDASRMVKRASISDEAFSRGLEERGQQAVEPSRFHLADAHAPEESSGRDQEWMPWMRRDKLQPSAVSASALAASSYRSNHFT
jgi:hypothetical protein